jgi:hypothetical protein
LKSSQAPLSAASNTSYTAMETLTFKLFCWILDKFGSPFPVVVEGSASIADLKELIVEKNTNTLASVDAHELTVWKVRGISFFGFRVLPADSIGKLDEAQPADSVNAFIAELLSHPTELPKYATKLNSLSKLSSVFREDKPKEEHLHVVVERPVTGEYQSYHMQTVFMSSLYLYYTSSSCLLTRRHTLQPLCTILFSPLD